MSHIKNRLKQYRDKYSKYSKHDGLYVEDVLARAVDEQPTAFDLDKVMEQLEDRSALARPVGWSKAYEIIMLKDAIEIVKGGGVE